MYVVINSLFHLSIDEESPKPTFDKQPLNWEEDVQMYSKFLDRKVCKIFRKQFTNYPSFLTRIVNVLKSS